MQTMQDRELLKKFVHARDPRAFAELVRRHIDLVYAAARRQLRDPGAVEDVTQSVFVLLSKKAHTIRDSEALPGWLLIATRCLVLNLIRTEARRRKHEGRAAEMNQQTQLDPPPQWDSIRPFLDEAVATLKREDRDAITLRYFKGQSVGEVACVLGVSSDAAQKRVLRAVDRLRQFFARRGVTATSDALASALAVNVLSQAPAELSAQVASSALAAGEAIVESSTIVSKALAMLTVSAQTKVVVSAAAAAIAAAIATPVVIHQTQPQALSPAAPAVVVMAAQPAAEPAEQWKARFNEVYSLADDEFVKRVPPPFIPERDKAINGVNFVGRTAVNPGRLGQPMPMESAMFRFDGNETRWSGGYRDTMDLGEIFKRMLNVWPQDTDIDRGLIGTRVPGDWVIRADSAPEKRFEGVMRSVGDLVGAGTMLRSEEMEREVIVVRGTLKYAEPLKEREGFPTVHLHLGNDRPPRAFNLSVGQTPGEVFQIIGELVNRPMIVEAEVGNNKAAAVAMYEIADFRRGAATLNDDAIDQIMANLSKQTTLEFKRERRKVPTWRLVKQEL
jgi:RNA polymerase sigma factor (sigma-70 family)